VAAGMRCWRGIKVVDCLNRYRALCHPALPVSARMSSRLERPDAGDRLPQRPVMFAAGRGTRGICRST